MPTGIPGSGPYARGAKKAAKKTANGHVWSLDTLTALAQALGNIEETVQSEAGFRSGTLVLAINPNTQVTAIYENGKWKLSLV